MLLATSTSLSESAAQVAAGELEPDLLERCRAGDREALRHFVHCYERRVFAFLSRALIAPSQVDDLAQEVFIRAYQGLPKFDINGSARLSTWLYTIVYRVVIDARRRSRVRPAGTTEPSASSSARDNPEHDYWRNQLNSAMARAAAQLPADQRDTFILAEYHDLSVAEIAHVTGVASATVKTRLFRARARLRELLAPIWEAAR